MWWHATNWGTVTSPELMSSGGGLFFEWGQHLSTARLGLDRIAAQQIGTSNLAQTPTLNEAASTHTASGVDVSEQL